MPCTWVGIIISVGYYMVISIRTLGSAVCSLCMVANGGADAYIEYGLHCWDIAAGSLIVCEAGGVALYPTGIDMIFNAWSNYYICRWTTRYNGKRCIGC